MAQIDTIAQWKAIEQNINFILANDLGRNGYYDQRTVAATMGSVAENIDIECVVAAGDVHHFEGVRSTSDPLWFTNFELIYNHPDLMIPWYAICGNHEYRSNPQAVVDYSDVSARWRTPARYYTRVIEDDGITIRLVMLDTSPLIDKYRNDSGKYPDAVRQNLNRQLRWLDKTLAAATEDWVVVVGHHPIYAYTPKAESERTDMQRRVDSILRRHSCVDMYLCGHIHNFQHIRAEGSDIDYVVNSSGSLSRSVKPIAGTLFCSDATGFSVVSANKSTLTLTMLDAHGIPLHTVTRSK